MVGLSSRGRELPIFRGLRDAWGQPCLGEFGPRPLQSLDSHLDEFSLLNVYGPPALPSLGWVLGMDKSGCLPPRVCSLVGRQLVWFHHLLTLFSSMEALLQLKVPWR